MKIVKLSGNIVREVIPEYALPVEQWYGEEFAKSCVEAPDEVNQRWVYDPETKTFSEPKPTEHIPTSEERLTALESAMLSLMEVNSDV